MKLLSTIFLNFIILYLLFGCEQKPKEAPFLLPENLNFASHIAPVIHQNCTPCHKEDGVAPFTLINYKDVAKRAKDINYVINNKVMPPWKADNHYISFKNERILSTNEIKTLTAWLEGDLARGNDDEIELPASLAAQQNTDADMVLEIPYPNIIPGDNSETFLLNYIPFELDEDHYVRSIEFVPGNKKKVHHCTYYFFDVDESVELQGDNGPFDVDVAVKHTEEVKARYNALTRNMVFYSGWIPGAGAVSFSEEMGFKLPKRGMLMMTLHYAPSPVEDKDKSYLKIYYHKKPVKRLVRNITFGTSGVGQVTPPLILKPETVSKHSVTVPISNDVSVLSVWPHMHYLGKNFKAYALDPKNDTIRLVKINDWDFLWQEIYYFKNPVKIPKGSKVMIEATFDNTSQNISNPFSPPQLVISKGNMASTDEMLTMMLMYLEYKQGDEKIVL
jgi:hypothetical protein